MVNIDNILSLKIIPANCSTLRALFLLTVGMSSRVVSVGRSQR